jgi:hypothetical protein
MRTIIDIFTLIGLLIITPFAYLFSLITNLSKCKYWKHCTQYNCLSKSCEKEQGNAYGLGFEFRPGGCYRNLEELGKESKYWR